MDNNKKYILVALVVALFVGGWYFLDLGRQKMSVTVSGEGSLVVPVGQVSMVVTSASAGESAGEAITAGEVTMSKLIEATKKMMGSDTEIRKSFYQVSPQGDGKFVMANAISIKANDISKTGDLIRFLYANGANTVSGVTFIPQDVDKVEQQIREAAIKDAKENATKIALSMGKKIGNLVSVSDDGGVVGGSVSDGVGTNVNFSTVRIEKKMVVIYEVK